MHRIRVHSFPHLALLLQLVAMPASAERMKFEYWFKDGSLLKGELDGTVLPDGDVVLVNGVSKVSFRSVAYPSVEAAEISAFEGVAPVVTFSGAVKDLAVCPDGFGAGCPYRADSHLGGFALVGSMAIAADRFGAANPKASIEVVPWSSELDNWSLCRVPSKGPCPRAKPPREERSRLFIDPVFWRPRDVMEIRDVVYGEAEVDWNEGEGAPFPTKQLLLDIYLPVGPKPPEKLPGYVFVHGGGFVLGDKAERFYAWSAREFATRGYVAVSINYRLAGDDPPPSAFGGDRNVDAAILDTAMAVNWMRDHADELNVDADRIVLGGVSAGAAAALFVGTIGGGPGGPGPARIAEVAAVVDLMSGMWGFESVLVDPSDPPTFIGMSTDDFTYFGALGLEQEFLEHGVTYAYPLVEGVGHDYLSVLMTEVDETGRTVQDEMFDFLYDVLDLGSLDPH